jgi:hypothetical protein
MAAACLEGMEAGALGVVAILEEMAVVVGFKSGICICNDGMRSILWEWECINRT